MNILYENEFLAIEMINANYPFVHYKKGGAIVVPYDSEGNVYLLYRNRVSIGKGYELPRGFVEKEETYKVGALRELNEETGMTVSKVDHLGYVQPDTGITNNKIRVYAVLVEEHNDYDYCDQDGGDNYKIKKVNKQMLRELIINNSIYCGLSLAALQKYFFIMEK